MICFFIFELYYVFYISIKGRFIFFLNVEFCLKFKKFDDISVVMKWNFIIDYYKV